MMTKWPHAPPHILLEGGVYMVTAGTYLKVHYLNDAESRNLFQDSLLGLTKKFGWDLHAWAILSNHYHFIANSANSSNLLSMLAQLHQSSSSALNARDQTPNRKVWHSFRDTKITIQTSYLARLNYVHQNPVKHGVVARACLYPWCSAAKFEMQANASFVKSVYSFDYTKVKVFDDF